MLKVSAESEEGEMRTYKITLTVTLQNGASKEIAGEGLGLLAATPIVHNFTGQRARNITHVPTGAKMNRRPYASKKEALEAIVRFLEVSDWNFKAFDTEARRAAYDAARARGLLR